MSTTALVGTTQPSMYSGLVEKRPTTKEIVRWEIKRQKELDKLEEKYKAGEISKFEYYVNKAVINIMPCPEPDHTVMYMA